MSSHLRARLRDFVLATTDKPVAVLHDDTALFEGGLLKSIHVMDLILLIEELSGASVDVEHLKPGAFRDVDTIVKGFFPVGATTSVEEDA